MALALASLLARGKFMSESIKSDVQDTMRRSRAGPDQKWWDAGLSRIAT